ncbi:MAG: hypothetical protein DME93_01880 [Verrucomicrobia bacterium]|nr:MAG: hypothetical protein DME93_01880 [Verrucomicrobiota bacterium]
MRSDDDTAETCFLFSVASSHRLLIDYHQENGPYGRGAGVGRGRGVGLRVGVAVEVGVGVGDGPPPFVVRRIVPPSPTTMPLNASLAKEISLMLAEVPLVWSVHVIPASVE